MKTLIIILAIICSFLSGVSCQNVNTDMQVVLEKFCKERYAECFPGRKYIDRSLTITSVEKNGSIIKVRGRHNYIGYLGKAYVDVDFKADVTYDGTEIVIIFYKWFVPAIKVIDGHWEYCEKRISRN